MKQSINDEKDKIAQGHFQLKEPPIGLMPKHIHDSKRFSDVCSAILRYFNAGLKIPVEWINEYNAFIENNKEEKNDEEEKLKQMNEATEIRRWL